MSPLVQRLLEERGVADADSFLNPQYEARHDPFLLTDMGRAVERILAAIKNGERIAVWHDYDCDGIPGGSLLHDFFARINYPIRMHVAERNEGYGLNAPGITQLADEGVKVLITVDCGITDVAEVALASSFGIDVIVTDHHLPQVELPPAYAVINAHRAGDTYPFKGLCGTGVAFKLVEALIQKGNFDLPKGWEKWLLDLVALATVADMVPMVDENRTLTRYGLHVIARGRRKGLAALLRKEKIPLEFVTEDDLGFSVAPKINAASRMESPRLAVELLTTTDARRADELATQLVNLNKARKLEGARVAKEVKHRLENMPSTGNIIVMGSQEWRPSLLGIAGNNIVETYGKTVCLWGRDGDLLKGSIRSNGRVNVVDLMTRAKHAFVDFGGHELSGGFSLQPEMIHKLQEILEEAVKELGSAEPLEKVLGNCPPGQFGQTVFSMLSLADVTNSNYESLRMLAPFGIENEKPIFRFDQVTVERVMLFGGHKEHARLTLSDLRSNSVDAIAFFISRTSFKDELELLSPGDRVVLDASIERSYFRNRPELRLRIQNLRV